MLVNKLLIILVIIVLDSTLKTFYKLFTFSNRNMVGISQNKIAHQKFVSRIFVVCRGRFFQIFFVVSQIIRMLGRSYLEVPLYSTLNHPGLCAMQSVWCALMNTPIAHLASVARNHSNNNILLQQNVQIAQWVIFINIAIPQMFEHNEPINT